MIRISDIRPLRRDIRKVRKILRQMPLDEFESAVRSLASTYANFSRRVSPSEARQNRELISRAIMFAGFFERWPRELDRLDPMK